MVQGSLSQELSGSGLIKCPRRKRGVSNTEDNPAFFFFSFLGLFKKKKPKKRPTKQKIIQRKFKSGLLIYNYICVCMCIYMSFIKTPTHVIKAAKCLAFQGLVRIIRYLYPIKLV